MNNRKEMLKKKKKREYNRQGEMELGVSRLFCLLVVYLVFMEFGVGMEEGQEGGI